VGGWPRIGAVREFGSKSLTGVQRQCSGTRPEGPKSWRTFVNVSNKSWNQVKRNQIALRDNATTIFRLPNPGWQVPRNQSLCFLGFQSLPLISSVVYPETQAVQSSDMFKPLQYYLHILQYPSYILGSAQTKNSYFSSVDLLSMHMLNFVQLQLL